MNLKLGQKSLFINGICWELFISRYPRKRNYMQCTWTLSAVRTVWASSVRDATWPTDSTNFQFKRPFLCLVALLSLTWAKQTVNDENSLRCYSPVAGREVPHAERRESPATASSQHYSKRNSENPRSLKSLAKMAPLRGFSSDVRLRVNTRPKS